MITLSDAQWATAAIASMEAEFLVSLMSPASMIGTPPAIAPQNHLKLAMDDITGTIDGYIAPRREHVEQLLEFGSRLDDGSEVVVHCVMGMSRSPAAIMILLAQHNPGREAELADAFFNEAPQIRPNRLLLELGDEMLGCGGDLVSAGYIDIPFSSVQQPNYFGSLDGFHSLPLTLVQEDA